MAVLGTLKMILGFKPLVNALMPLSLNNALVADLNPVTYFIFSFLEIPLVCNAVLIQSKGFVMAAAIPPAIPPETQCKYGLYTLFGFNTDDEYS